MLTAKRQYQLEQWSSAEVPWNPRVPSAHSRDSARSYTYATMDSIFSLSCADIWTGFREPLEHILGVSAPPKRLLKSQSQSPFPRPMAKRAASISFSIALGHASANAVKATAGGWSTGSSACLTSPRLSHLSSTRREGSEYHFKSLCYDSARVRTQDLPIVI